MLVSCCLVAFSVDFWYVISCCYNCDLCSTISFVRPLSLLVVTHISVVQNPIVFVFRYSRLLSCSPPELSTPFRSCFSIASVNCLLFHPRRLSSLQIYCSILVCSLHSHNPYNFSPLISSLRVFTESIRFWIEFIRRANTWTFLVVSSLFLIAYSRVSTFPFNSASFPAIFFDRFLELRYAYDSQVFLVLLSRIRRLSCFCLR